MREGLEKPQNNKQDPFTPDSINRVCSSKHQISTTCQSTQTSERLENWP